MTSARMSFSLYVAKQASATFV